MVPFYLETGSGSLYGSGGRVLPGSFRPESLVILPGGGVSPENAARILSETGASEIHASASESVGGIRQTSTGKVAAILTAISRP